MEIVVIGMGYVGIPSAVLFADVEGINVVGIQRRSKRSGWKIDYLNQGKCPIEGDEPGLKELIEKVVKKGSFKVTDDVSVCSNADAVLIDVQTPVNEKHLPKYESLKEVTQKVGKYMKNGTMIIIESTVAPGTTNYLVKPILEKTSGMEAGKNFNLVYSYERVMVGRLLYNLKNMPRIVGGYTQECTKRGIKLYKNVCNAELFPTDTLTAEVAKVTENTYRDVNIAFANEIALICESLGVNANEVRQYVNSLPFDSSDPLKNPYRMMHVPGAGVGGHCLPKDPWLLKNSIDQYGKFKLKPNILVESRKINDYMPIHMKELIEEALTENKILLQNSKICILGLAFLGDSDDTRNTPTLSLFNSLEGKCKEVTIHDPYVKEFENLPINNNLTNAILNKDCIAIVTPHSMYKKIDPKWLKKTLRTPIIVDGRNIFEPKKYIHTGFTYRGIGLGKKL
jgi:UDP-N-acetyl-D-mannosaminuronic acid dehydrogenase